MLSVFIPPTGIPLPFISFGGSSLVVFLSAVGILLNISKQSDFNYNSDMQSSKNINFKAILKFGGKRASVNFLNK